MQALTTLELYRAAGDPGGGATHGRAGGHGTHRRERRAGVLYFKFTILVNC